MLGCRTDPIKALRHSSRSVELPRHFAAPVRVVSPQTRETVSRVNSRAEPIGFGRCATCCSFFPPYSSLCLVTAHAVLRTALTAVNQSVFPGFMSGSSFLVHGCEAP